MKSLNYCLDTHPLIWYFSGQETLSLKAKEIIDSIFTGKITCFISSIVLLEAYHLSLKKKNFIFPIFLKKIRMTNILIVPLDKIVLSKCFELSPSLDIHDRIIAATAIVNKSVLITKDDLLQKYSKVATLW